MKEVKNKLNLEERIAVAILLCFSILLVVFVYFESYKYAKIETVLQKASDVIRIEYDRGNTNIYEVCADVDLDTNILNKYSYCY